MLYQRAPAYVLESVSQLATCPCFYLVCPFIKSLTQCLPTYLSFLNQSFAYTSNSTFDPFDRSFLRLKSHSSYPGILLTILKTTTAARLAGSESQASLIRVLSAPLSTKDFALLCSQKPYLYAPFPFLGHRESNTFYLISFPYMTLAIWLGFLLRAYALSS